MACKLLSIVIPYYTETKEQIFPLLSSINNQLGIDFNTIECVLVNDGNNNVLPDDFLLIFEKLNIRCIYAEENRGPGVARQIGIDSSLGEYIMFCDADDTLHSVGVIGMFLQEINANRPDIITSLWLEELTDFNGEYTYITHEDEATWMHGKVFRRIYLQCAGIRFHNKLRVHEDSYFLALALADTKNKRKCPVVSYVWKFNPDSITRRNNAAYTFASFPEFIKAIVLSFEVLEKHSFADMTYKIVQFVLYNYFILHKQMWMAKENSEHLKAAETAFACHISPFIHYYENAPVEFIASIYNQERAKLFAGQIETELLHNWLSGLQIHNTNKRQETVNGSAV